MPKQYPKEFRDDVVRVARNREPGQQLRQIAADFGISESCLTNWLKRADVEDGHAPAVTSEQNADLRVPRDESGCWSRRTKCCGARLRTCRRRTCPQNDVPARP